MDATAPRLVASDLDGTLLAPDGSVSARTGEVWAGLAARGVQTVVVTARPPRWLHHLSDVVGNGVVDGAASKSETSPPEGASADLRNGAGEECARRPAAVAICANGAFVYDVAARRVVEAHGFTAVQACDLVAAIQRDFPHAGAAVETDRGMFRTSAYPDPHAGLPGHDVVVAGLPDDGRTDGRSADRDARAEAGACDGVIDCELSDLPDGLVVGKILLRDEAWVDDSFVADVTDCVGERGVLAYSGAAGLAEISAPGVTKAARLAAWCDERGIDAQDVWAFGDMPNDIPMLTWAGRGVAVANAHPEVLAIADDTCAANDADGVAEYLATHLGA